MDDPAKRPGAQTSEYRLTVRAFVAGLVMCALGTGLAVAGALLADAGAARDLLDLARTLIWGGVGTLAGPTVTYQFTRANLKKPFNRP
ncbi:MAG: hypothetical protein KQI62_02315 [Deltaproteobacteria bacterium]|nr:hypothetical protein [Deltaproteobacteria bacterium]